MNESTIVIKELDEMITRCLYLIQNISGCPNEIVQSIGKVKDWTRTNKGHQSTIKNDKNEHECSRKL